MSSLLVFTTSLYGLAILTYGLAAPTGLFVPSILCGAAYGRLVSQPSRAVAHDGPNRLFLACGVSFARCTVSAYFLSCETAQARGPNAHRCV